MEVLLLVAERDGPENAGADCGHESIEPARRESAASAATETGQGFSDCSVIQPPHGQATATASATIAATITRKTTASKSDMSHIARPLGFIRGPCRPLYPMGLHHSRIDLRQLPTASSRWNNLASGRHPGLDARQTGRLRRSQPLTGAVFHCTLMRLIAARAKLSRSRQRRGSRLNSDSRGRPFTAACASLNRPPFAFNSIAHTSPEGPNSIRSGQPAQVPIFFSLAAVTISRFSPDAGCMKSQPGMIQRLMVSTTAQCN